MSPSRPQHLIAFAAAYLLLFLGLAGFSAWADVELLLRGEPGFATVRSIREIRRVHDKGQTAILTAIGAAIRAWALRRQA